MLWIYRVLSFLRNNLHADVDVIVLMTMLKYLIYTLFHVFHLSIY
jgi:hypothetical protein